MSEEEPVLEGTSHLDPGASGIAAVSGLSPGGMGIGPVVSDPATSTPLEEGEPEDAIPPAPLWAMKDRMHSRRSYEPDDPGSINGRVGDEDAAIYFIDDGPEHCMMGRRVGRSSDGCVYCLVGRNSVFAYEQLRDAEIEVSDAFSDARDIALCGVFEDQGASNVMVVQTYRHASSIPAEYLPPNPFIEFTDAQGDD
jgi:hypothetical protein